MPPVDQVSPGGDGLAELDKRRQRRRPLPPRNPRVPPSSSTASAPAVAGEPGDRVGESAEPETPVPVEPPTLEPTSIVEPLGVTATEEEAEVEPVQEAADVLRLAQFYVTPAIDKYLRAVRAEALTQDVDVTASAVARMALQRLADETTPQELVRKLGGPKKRKGRGRPRR